MKALLINGSPHKKGNTYIALHEMEQIFQAENIDTELIQIGHLDIRGCIGCYRCKETGRCVFNDIVNEIAPKFEESEALIVGVPVYYGSANATMVAFLTRLFYSTPFDKTMKVGAAIAAARRGGLTSTFDELNKFFTISGMAIPGSQYWNGVHGRDLGEANEDKEGLQVMRTLAYNAVFLMRSIELGKEKYGLPKKEERIITNFVR